MTTDSINECLEQAVDWIRKHKQKGKNQRDSYYADLVKQFYETVEGLLEEGFNFQAICDGCIQSGIFPEMATYRGLRKAYLRERERRFKRGNMNRETVKSDYDTRKKERQQVQTATDHPEATAVIRGDPSTFEIRSLKETLFDQEKER